MTRFDDWRHMVTVGTVARTHGRRGQVVVNPLTDFPESRFCVGELVYTKAGTVITGRRIMEMRFQGGRPVVGFENIHSINDAEGLRDCELRVPESALSQLPTGTYYIHELIGCEVVTSGGKSVGVVSKVEGPAALQRLIVVKEKRVYDVPLVDAVCLSIDVDSRHICIDPPVGLLELNER